MQGNTDISAHKSSEVARGKVIPVPKGPAAPEFPNDPALAHRPVSLAFEAAQVAKNQQGSSRNPAQTTQPAQTQSPLKPDPASRIMRLSRARERSEGENHSPAPSPSGPLSLSGVCQQSPTDSWSPRPGTPAPRRAPLGNQSSSTSRASFASARASPTSSPASETSAFTSSQVSGVASRVMPRRSENRSRASISCSFASW